MGKKKIAAVSAVPVPATGDRNVDQDRLALKKKVRYFYDLQRLRLQTGGRLLKRAKGNTIELHEYDKDLLSRRAGELEGAEKTALGDVADHLKTIPFYAQVLSDKVRYRGVGPTMAGVILAEYDIRRLENASQMWSFAGLAPIPARRCKSCHSVVDDGKHTARKVFNKEGAPTDEKIKCEYASQTIGDDLTYASGKAMRPTKGQKLPYNAFLKTKLVGVLGGVILKSSLYKCRLCGEKVTKFVAKPDAEEAEADAPKFYSHPDDSTCAHSGATIDASVVIREDSPWRKFYDDYKNRKASAGWGRSDAHRHQAAIRYMIKMLLLDIWTQWRTFEKLPVRPPYQEEYLGHTHHAESGTSPVVPVRAVGPASSIDQKRATPTAAPVRNKRAESAVSPVFHTRAEIEISEQDAEIEAEVAIANA